MAMAVLTRHLVLRPVTRQALSVLKAQRTLSPHSASPWFSSSSSSFSSSSSSSSLSSSFLFRQPNFFNSRSAFRLPSSSSSFATAALLQQPAKAATTTTMGSSDVATPIPAPLTSTIAADVDLSNYDDEQVKLMEEMCIVIDRDDKRIGADSKKTCHLMTNILGHNLLHRAFSVFLFSADGTKLLLQQRATEKITFPDAWTNTCCSHPLNTADELVEKDNLGVRTAAQRKLFHELGIEAKDVPLDDFHFLTRIHYLAPSNETWGEHEIDYILFMRPQHKELVDMNPSPNEVRDVRWVTKDELKVLLEQGVTPGSGIIVTPWFKLICDNFMFAWWDRMMAEGDVSKVARAEEVEKIYRL
ncbi:isopentenyl diphosphate isomerase [Linnemannia elongata]|nr:isopentenyl diphosphate isomerase [Linnemannia elongata]